MSLLDKHEVQDVCEHTALRARKWSSYMGERQKIRHYRARSTDERRSRRKKNNAKSRFLVL